jgi:hypothetical protein
VSDVLILRHSWKCDASVDMPSLTIRTLEEPADTSYPLTVHYAKDILTLVAERLHAPECN